MSPKARGSALNGAMGTVFLTPSIWACYLGMAIEYLLQATTGSSSGLRAIENGALCSGSLNAHAPANSPSSILADVVS